MVVEDSITRRPLTTEVLAPINNLYWNKHQGGITEEDSPILRNFLSMLEEQYGVRVITNYLGGQHLIKEILIVNEAKYNWFLLKWS